MSSVAKGGGNPLANLHRNSQKYLRRAKSEVSIIFFLLAVFALFSSCTAQQGHHVTVVYDSELSKEVWSNFTLVYPDGTSESTLDIAYPGAFPAFRFSVPRGNISIKVGIYNYSGRFFQPDGIEFSTVAGKNFFVEKDMEVLVSISDGGVKIGELREIQTAGSSRT